MILDEFLVKLGVISDPKDIDTFVGGLQKAAAVATSVVAVVGGVTAAITSFFGAALEGLDSLNDLAQDTDTDLAYIQKLGYAAQLSGSSVEAANASVKGLAQTIGEAASGLGRGEAAFKAYGLSAKNADGSVKSVGEVLEEVQAKMVGLSKSEQLSMLNKLGIDQSMIGMLNNTNAEMGALFQQAEDLGLVTAAGADAAGEFNDTMDQMNMVMGAIRTNIAVGLAPQLTNIVGRLRDWLIRNKELIREGINKAVTVILALWRAIMRAVDVVDSIISKTIGWKAALLILAAALIWFNKAMLLAFATNPITLIAAAIAGLILLLDDLMTFLEGGESMFDWSWAVPIIESVGGAIDSVGQVLRDLWDKYGEHVLGGFAGLWDFIKGFFGFLGNAFAAVFSLITGDFDGFLRYAEGAINGLRQMFAGATQYIQSLFSLLWTIISSGFSGVVGALSSLMSGLLAFLSIAAAAVGDAFSAAWNGIKAGFAAVGDNITSLLSGVETALLNGALAISGAFSAAWDGIKAGFSALGEGLSSVMSGVENGLLNAALAISGAFSAAWDGIKAGFSEAMGFVTSIWDKVSGSITKGLDAISGTLNWLGSKLGLTSETATAAAQQVDQATTAAATAAQQVNTASGTVASAQAAAHPGNNQSSVNNHNTSVNAPMQITQNITTSDPKAAGQHAADGIKREQQRATENYKGSYGL